MLRPKGWLNLPHSPTLPPPVTANAKDFLIDWRQSRKQISERSSVRKQKMLFTAAS